MGMSTDRYDINGNELPSAYTPEDSLEKKRIDDLVKRLKGLDIAPNGGRVLSAMDVEILWWVIGYAEALESHAEACMKKGV